MHVYACIYKYMHVYCTYAVCVRIWIVRIVYCIYRIYRHKKDFFYCSALTADLLVVDRPHHMRGMVPVSPAGTRGNFPRMCEAGGMKVHQPELGSNLSRWIKLVHDLDLDSDQRRTTLQWHSIMMRRHAYSLLAETRILKMGIFGIWYHHTFIYIHIRAYTCIYVHIHAFHT